MKKSQVKIYVLLLSNITVRFHMGHQIVLDDCEVDILDTNGKQYLQMAGLH